MGDKNEKNQMNEISSMNQPDADFAAYYSTLGEPELMALARSYDTLVGPAQAALREEFARRRLEPPLLDEDDPGTPTQRNLVTISRYRDLSEAIVARSMLESADIPVYLRDENLVRLDWQVSNFIGGIRLQVDAENELAAAELLNRPVDNSISDGEGGTFLQPRCPRCGSAEITFEGASRGGALAALFVLSLPLPPGPKTWRCETCGAHWQDAEA
jgi:hypothetical protein